MAIFNLDPNLNTVLISVVISLMSLLYREHKFLKKKIYNLEKKIKKLEREFNAIKRKHS
jgi:uncharacterized membrane protein (DUF106 family)